MKKRFFIVGIGVVLGFWNRKKIINYFAPKESKKSKKRKLGILDGKAQVIFREDFSMTEEEFLSLN